MLAIDEDSFLLSSPAYIVGTDHGCFSKKVKEEIVEACVESVSSRSERELPAHDAAQKK